MLENAFRIAVDPIYPPPPEKEWSIGKKNNIPEFIFE